MSKLTPEERTPLSAEDVAALEAIEDVSELEPERYIYWIKRCLDHIAIRAARIAELHERESALIYDLREKDSRIAELEGALESILKIEQDDAVGWLNAALQIKRICRAALGESNETDK